ncbi:MAG: hypothetical protein IJH17_03240, partial [Clostridia bacterium]|nr:hypothetical protein [Clostridia bacterium]
MPAFAEEPSYSGGSGTKDDPYLISTAEDMWSLSDECKDKPQHTEMYTGKYFKVTNDINLGCSEDKQWMPIADYNGNNIRFCGTFDGDGHTISGLYINGQDDYAGLFGFVQDEGHSIINLNVEGYVKGAWDCGGIVGKLYNYASVRNCSFKGEVSGTYYVGGIVGKISGRGAVSGCTVSGKITGGKNAGGIVGSGDVCQSFSNCVNQAKVTGTESVGGLMGNMWLDATMTNCYNSGEVKGTENVGGLVGSGLQKGNIAECYNTGNVTGKNNVGGIYGYCAPDANITKCYNTGGVNAEYVGGGIAGYMISGTYIENCYNLGNVNATENAGGIGGIYSSSSLGDYKNTKLVNVYNIGKVTAALNPGGVFGCNKSESLRSTADIVTSTACYIDTACNEECAGTKLTAAQFAKESTFSGWSGFSNNWVMPKGAGRPMLKSLDEGIAIKTGEDFVEIYENVKKGNRYTNVYIYLENDIDLDGYDWLPIGSYSVDENGRMPFCGNFNGNGYTISNLNCDAGSEEYQGLFGYVGAGGQVRNVIMDDSCFFSAGEHTAAIAGLNAGTIENCKNYAEVIGDEFTGGIAGENQNGGLITKCYNAGAISSTASEVGGIVGYNIEATVSKCVNDGSVDADVSFSGGIVGQNHTGTIENSYNTGEVQAVRAYTGGVVGQSIGSGAKVSNCYSTGRVYSYEISGGVAGSNKNSSAIEKCYYLEDMADGGISGDNSPRSAADIAGSAEKLTEEQFANQSSFSGWNFDNVWLLGDRPLLEFGLVLKGKGTEEEPYLIGSAGDLSTMRALVNNGKTKAGVHYLLTNDIDLENKEVMPIGCGSYFYGIFDGGGHKITGFTIRNITMSNNGLFGGVSIGVIKNLRVEGDIDIKTSKPYGSFNIGGIVGVNNGTIENCSFSGSVKNSTNIFSYIGGIAGKNEKGTISDCYFEGELDAILANGNSSEGGIAGANYNATITRCYNSGDISGGASAGGITGYNYSLDGSSSISNCYNTGSVSVKKDGGKAAGIVGDWYLTQTSSKNEITSCYNTGKISGTNAYAIITEDSKRTLEPTVTYCYYLTGTGDDSSNSNEMTAKHFASGLVAYMLQNDDYGMIWGQRLKGENKDASPILTSDTNKSVHRINYETDDNSRYATGYATGEGIGELPTVPSTSTRTFVGWSLSQRNFSNLLTEDTPITKDVYAYAVSQEMYGETDSDKTVQINYGKGGSVDLSQYIVYQNGSSTNGKYTYTINSGNDALNAAISGDMLTIPTSAPVGTYNLSVTATEKTPNISLMSVSFDNLPVTMNITVIVGKRDAEITAPKAKSLTYSGSEQELVTAGATSG